MELKKFKLEELVPYENNPRFNDYAVEPTMESINQVGYITPIIVDEDNVILAGHTRLRALEGLGIEEVDCVVLKGLSDDQKRKFRILDNKTGELAEWDNELLKGELENLDLGNVHWFDNIINPAIEALAGQGTKKESSGKGAEEDEDDGTVIYPRCGAVIEVLDFGGYDDSEDETISWSDEE